MTSRASTAAAFLPLIFLSIPACVVAYKLATEKGRNVGLWTVLGAIPFVNFVCLWFFVGATNLQMEGKLDELLRRTGGEDSGGNTGPTAEI